MHFYERISEIVERIQKGEKTREELARKLRLTSGKIEYPEMLEQGLVLPVSETPLNGKIAAVDSGIIGEEFHGFDFLIMRSVGAIFEYENSRVKSYKYFPSSLPKMEADIRSGLDSHEVMWHKSLYRLRGELVCSSSLIEKHRPGCLLIDGSIAPLLSDKPSEESEMRELYEEAVQAYRKLYETAWNSGCVLAGVIKDSRSKRFIDMLAKHSQNEPGFLHTTDTNFLYFMLEAGERTCAFPYSSSPAKHQILKDLGEWSNKILSFYLKPVKGDRPLRVEFLSGQKTFDEVASLVHSLSCIHKAYAYPAVLIEADLRAALAPDEFEKAYGSLFSRLGNNPSLLRLRRNMRPFR